MVIYQFRRTLSSYLSEWSPIMWFIWLQKWAVSMQTWTIRWGFSRKTLQWMAISFGPHMLIASESLFACWARVYTQTRLSTPSRLPLCMQVHPTPRTKATPTLSACAQSNAISTMNSMAQTSWPWCRPIYMDRTIATQRSQAMSSQHWLEERLSVKCRERLWRCGARAPLWGNSVTHPIWHSFCFGSHSIVRVIGKSCRGESLLHWCLKRSTQLRIWPELLLLNFQAGKSSSIRPRLMDSTASAWETRSWRAYSRGLSSQG